MELIKKDKLKKKSARKVSKIKLIDRSKFLGSIDFKEDPIKMQRRMRGYDE